MDELDDLLERWGRASDDEKIIFLVIIGAFFCSVPVCTVLYQGYSLADAFNQPNVRGALLYFGLPGFLMLFLAIAIWWRKRRRSGK